MESGLSRALLLLNRLKEYCLVELLISILANNLTTVVTPRCIVIQRLLLNRRQLKEVSNKENADTTKSLILSLWKDLSVTKRVIDETGNSLR